MKVTSTGFDMWTSQCSSKLCDPREEKFLGKDGGLSWLWIYYVNLNRGSGEFEIKKKCPEIVGTEGQGMRTWDRSSFRQTCRKRLS